MASVAITSVTWIADFVEVGATNLIGVGQRLSGMDLVDHGPEIDGFRGLLRIGLIGVVA